MLKVGKCVTTRNIRHYWNKNWLEFKAEKGKNMVFLYLGQEPVDGSNPIEPDKVMESMGWKLTSE